VKFIGPNTRLQVNTEYTTFGGSPGAI